jgi:hypothetical protein
LHEERPRAGVGSGEQAPVDAMFGRDEGRELRETFR